MTINVDVFLKVSLPILAKGMLGIFFVMGVILLSTFALNAIFKD